MNTLIKSILFAAMVCVAQISSAAQLYFDPGIGLADGDGDSELYLKLGMGGKLSKELSVEGGYLDIDQVDGFFGNVKYSHRLNKDTQLFGKLGLYIWDAGPADGNDLLFGGGVTFEKVGPGDVNLELLLTDLDGSDVTLIGATWSIPIGR
jgi:hypothetical protein